MTNPTEPTAPEEWRRIPEFTDYEVSSRGRVRSWKSGTARPIKLRADKRGGYMVFMPCVDGVHRLRKVHAMVLAAFVGPYPKGMEVRHLDGDVTNNELSNLRYGTHAENIRDKKMHGTDGSAHKTHCIRGHAFDGRNTIIKANGSQRCRECKLMHERARYRRLVSGK